MSRWHYKFHQDYTFHQDHKSGDWEGALVVSKAGWDTCNMWSVKVILRRTHF
jgi:hypothetical protein